ncbi:MAG TPA: microviridin/marinostatin family tricyclic proteinase inhibitor [Pyrinomonadaceae bacterium]|nr:microviridin/marinostatin family tricyclic proteinase inhibitor [Pyrinomonadaceae bacterium]
MRDKTEAHAPELSERSLPFFARYLEGQDTSEICSMTLKYPSDRDEIDNLLEYTSGDNEPVPPHK